MRGLAAEHTSDALPSGSRPRAGDAHGRNDDLDGHRPWPRTYRKMRSHSKAVGWRAWALVSAAAVLVLAAPAVQAQTTSGQTSAPPTGQPSSLGAVVVTATRSQTTLEQMPLHTTVIGRKDIQQSPARTLDQLLRAVPGMNLPGAPYYTTDPTGHQTRLRGATNSKVLVLLDGIPVHDPFYTTTQWFKVPLSSIERIEIVRGGGSSLWGNLAVAGVINIITTKPVTSEGEIQGSYQSQSTGSGALAKNFIAGNGLSLRLTADALKAGGYQTTPAELLGTMPGKAASSAKSGNVQLATYFAPNEDLTAFLRAGYHEQNEDVGGYAYGANVQKSPDAAAGLSRQLGEHARADVRAWTQYVDFDKSNGAACYLVSASSCGTTSPTSPRSPLVQYANSHDTNRYRELGASGVLSTFDASRLLGGVQTGVDFRRIGGDDRATTYDRPTTTDGSATRINRTNFGGGTQQFIGGFAQLQGSPLRALDVTLSARYDYWANTGGVSAMTRYANGVPGAPAGGDVADSHRASFNPSLSARYRLTDALSVRGATYRAFRAPGLNNLYRSFSSTTSITIANPTLSPETLTGGELGVDLRGGRASLGITYFRNDTKNLIAAFKVASVGTAPAAVTAICGPTLSNCPATVNFNTNGQDGVARGVELVSDWRATPWLALNGAYTYTDSHYSATSTGDPVGVQLGAVPTSLASLGATWQAGRSWSVYSGLRYNSSMYLDVNHTIPQSAFTLVDVGATYAVSRELELRGSIVNLGDVTYADNATTSAAGKTLGMPRAISSGVRWRF
jgi:outer membrane cobalamin receptor